MASIKKSPHVHHRHFCHFQLDTCQSCQLVKQHKRIFLHCKILVSPNWLSKDFSPTMRPLSPHNEHCLSNWEKAGATFPFPPPFHHQQSASLSTVPPRPPPSSWSCCTMCIVCQIGWKLPHSLPAKPPHNILWLNFFSPIATNTKKIWITAKFYVDLNQSTQWRIEDSRIEDIFQYKHLS